MSIVVKEGATFRSVDPGTYAAQCIRLIDIGTQETEYQGKKGFKQQVIITWELTNELIEDGDFAGQPYIVSKFYTASLDKKANLRKDLEAWRGKAFTEDELKGFSLKNILGKACMLSIIHTESGKAKVGAVMALPKGMTITSRINPLILFDITEWDDQVYAGLSDGIKGIIQRSQEYQKGNDIHDKTEDLTEPPIETDLEPF